MTYWCLVTFVACAITGIATAMNPLFFLEQYGIAEKTMGIMFVVAGGVAVVCQLCLTGFFTSRFGNLVTCMIGQAFNIPFGFAIVLLHFPALPWICMLCSTATGALVNPTSAAEVANIATDKNRGSLMGIYQSVRALGGAVGPVIGGRLYQNNIWQPFWIGNIWGLIMLCLSICYYYVTKPAPLAADKLESGTAKPPSETSQDDDDTKPPSERESEPAETQRDSSISRDRSLSESSAEAQKPVEACHA